MNTIDRGISFEDMVMNALEAGIREAVLKKAEELKKEFNREFDALVSEELTKMVIQVSKVISFQDMRDKIIIEVRKAGFGGVV